MATIRGEGFKEKLKNRLRSVISYIPNYYRYGKVYQQKINEIKKLPQDLEKFQLEKVRHIVRHAYNTVPYYKKLLDERKIDPNIPNYREFKKIPFLTKDIIRGNLKDLVSTSSVKKREVKTGGTMGMPMTLYLDSVDNKREMAYVDFHWGKIGVKNKKVNKVAVLRGTLPIGDQKFQKIGNKLIMSSFQLNSETAPLYIKALEEFSPEFIHIYPSSMSILARYILEKNIKLNLKNLKYILSSSETLYDFQKKEIRKAFDVEVCDLYGHTEHGVLALSYFIGDSYHLDPTYGYTEILDAHGKEVEYNEEGEITVTGFNTMSMPLIRYKTGDRAIKGKKNLELHQILGREQEYFINSNGEKVIFICSDEPFWGFESKVEAYQYVQNEKGKVTLKIIKKEILSTLEEENIKSYFKKLFKGIEIQIEYVEEILRTKRGKFRYLIQNLKEEK